MIPALLLILAATFYRVVSAVVVQHGGAAWLSNFAPLAAIALCGAIYFPRRYKFTVPLAVLFVSDLALDFFYHAAFFDPLILSRYVAFAFVGLLGLTISRNASVWKILGASLGASVFFYVATNFVSWLSDPGYVKNFAGLIQSLTVGLPQYTATPSWMFFRNSLVSDLFFTLLFVACLRWSAATSRRPALAAEPLPN